MPKKLINTKEITYAEWVDLRRLSIGGSDAATVMGVNKWASPLSLYANKKGMTSDPETNVAMQVGTHCEELVARMFEEEAGKKVRNDLFMYQHDLYPYITANLDRRIVGENAGLECKTSQAYTLKDFDGTVPENYYWQCVQYMAVMGFDRMYLAAILSNRHFVWRVIERNEEDIKKLIAKEVIFWTEFVEKDIMPEADGTDASAEALKEIYPAAEVEEIETDIDADAEMYLYAAEQEKTWKKRKEEAQQNMQAKLGTAERGIGAAYVATWKNMDTTRFDSKRFKEAHPDLYREFTTTTHGRRFSCKEAK